MTLGLDSGDNSLYGNTARIWTSAAAWQCRSGQEGKTEGFWQTHD